jgi:hypothetical protein
MGRRLNWLLLALGWLEFLTMGPIAAMDSGIALATCYTT